MDLPKLGALSRRQFLERASLAGAAGLAAPAQLAAASLSAPEMSGPETLLGASPVGGVAPSATHGESLREITEATIAEAEKLADLSFTPEQRTQMLEALVERLDVVRRLHENDIPNHVIPPQLFDPRVAGARPPVPEPRPQWQPDAQERPRSDEDLAFAPVHVLSGLLRTRQVTSVALTELYLERLERYNPVLQCVVTLTPERAMAQARAADQELDAGLWRGPLHGVPWGAKDLLSVKGYPTTWGAMPYRDQVIDSDAAVVSRLDAAGAVLVAKLTTGALAWGDIWFGGRTRNPWNVEQGASGSSAGPGSAVAAGLVGFAIGSETLGSIVSPSTRNGVAGLRPTFGRVSRSGAMTLSWSMDKLGPMCRSAFDCGLVFQAIHGQDDTDPTTVDADFAWPLSVRPENVRLGYVESAFEGDFQGAESDRAVLETLRRLGYEPRPMAWPDHDTAPMMFALSAETAAAFDHLTRSGGTDSMVSQNLWPESFRESRFITAVDYINGQRLRTLMMQDMGRLFDGFDVIVTNHRAGGLGITNLTGHPSVTVPNRLDPLPDDPDSPRRRPDAINFIGALYRDDIALSVAHAYQEATDFHLQRPSIQ